MSENPSATTTDATAMGSDAAVSRRRRYAERLRGGGVLMALIIFVVIFSVASPNFLTPGNFINVSRQISTNVIVACGMTFVIITAGIDLAVGSYVALSGVLVASLIAVFGVPWFFAIPLTLLILAFFGAFNGYAVAWQGLQPFVVTLAMFTAARGIALAYSNGEPIFVQDPVVLFLGNGYLGPIPVPVAIAIVVLVLSHVVLTRTKLGRYVYAVGGNERAARVSGINVARVKLFVYVLVAVLSALAGVITAGRLYSGNPTAGQLLELDVIAAVVIGGTSLFGGTGRIWGTLLGAFIIGIISNGLTILGVPDFYQQIVKGAVIFIAVLVDAKTRGAGE